MPRSGGTYSLPAGNPVAGGSVISSTTHNATMTDVADALTASLAKDGQTVPTANLPMGGYRHTNVDDAGARTDYARADQVQDGTLVYLTSVSGTNTITATAPLSLAAYAAGQAFRFIPANTNTGATTINLNSIGAKDIYNNGAALEGGELIANIPAEIIYDGTRFHILATAPRGWVLIDAQTASSSASLSFTGLSSAFASYQLVLENVKPATDDDHAALVIGTGAGPTYQTTGYTWGLTSIGVSGDAQDGSTTASIATAIRLNRSGSGNGVGNSTGEHVSGVVEFSGPTASDRVMFTWRGSLIRSDGVAQHVFGGGSYATSVGPITGLRFSFVSGNIASGVLKLYGLR